MTRIRLAVVFAMLAPISASNAQSPSVEYSAMIDRAIESYILHGFAYLSATTAALDTAAA